MSKKLHGSKMLKLNETDKKVLTACANFVIEQSPKKKDDLKSTQNQNSIKLN